MIKVGFTLIGGNNWTGGYNYLINLFRAISTHEANRITPVLFVGRDININDVEVFSSISGVEVIRSPLFNRKRRYLSLFETLLLGRSTAVTDLLNKNHVDIVFEAAQFFGWRLGIPALAWIPDFQHKYLRHMFSISAYWKRDLGFRAQIIGGRHIMLSSEDARNDCEKFYPASIGKTHVVRFAVSSASRISTKDAREIADSYNLPKYFFILPNQFWKHKNHTVVINALNFLKKRGESVVVAVPGKQFDPRDPGYFSQIQTRVIELGLENEFRLLGLIPYNHLLALISASAALINPSKFEGWSTTVEEAKALGVPMILSDLRVHIEQAGNNATYFNTDSPTQLADLLLKQISCPPTDSACSRHVIRPDLVKQYAMSFADLAFEISRSANPA